MVADSLVGVRRIDLGEARRHNTVDWTLLIKEIGVLLTIKSRGGRMEGQIINSRIG